MIASKLYRFAACPLAATALTLTAETAEEIVTLEPFVATATYLYTDQVNALRTPTPIIDVPQSLSITTADDISLRGFNSVEDIVAYTPGVNISQGEGHRDAVVFRGVRSTADFFVDGVRDDVQYYRPLYNVEQVEILRGPNALLFGRGGAGGVLNRVMKKADTTESFNGYSLAIDTFGAGEVQVDSNVQLSEESAFRINAYYDTFENDRDFSDGDGFGINPTFKFQLSETTALDLSYEYIDYDRSIDRGIPTGSDREPVEAFDDIVFGDRDLNESEFEAHVIRALFQHEFSDTLKGNLTASYGDYDKLYSNFYAADYDEANNTVDLDGYVDGTERQNFILSGNLIGQFETGDIEHTLMFGAEYIDSESENFRFNPKYGATTLVEDGKGGFRTDQERFKVSQVGSFQNGMGIRADGANVAATFTGFNDDTETELEVFSLYVQDEIKLLEQLTLVLGARFDSFDIEVENRDPDNLGSDGQKDEEFTPRGGIIYKPQEKLSLYASYSETFLPQSGEQFANLGDRGLDPDEYSNLETGIKWDFIEGLSFTAAIFRIEQDFLREDGNDTESIENEIEGFEAQIAGMINDKWYISAGYSYLTGELDGGNDPRELPENSFSIWNHYQVSDALGFGLGATYQDESFINTSNTATLPDFVRVDAAAYYQINDSLRLQVNVENLFDEEYYPSAHSTHQVTVGSPINARFTISGRF